MRVAALAAGLGLIVLAAVDGTGTTPAQRYADNAIGSPASAPESPVLFTDRELPLAPVVQPNDPALPEIAPAPLPEAVQTASDSLKPPRDRDEAQIQPVQNSSGQIWDGRCNGGPLLYGKMPVPQCPLAPGQGVPSSIRVPASPTTPRR
jgi:hypothetical protein